MIRKKQNKLFGTDGIRKKFGEFPLDNVSIIKLGAAMGQLLEGSKIAVAMDTRDSGPEIVRAIAAGINGRADIFDCGVIPTPGLSYIVERDSFDYGIMITASHNPWFDNGIKLFGGNGEKIPPLLEQNIEELFFASPDPENHPLPSQSRKKGEFQHKRSRYVEFLSGIANRLDCKKKKSFKVVLDCANGATYETAPEVFSSAGFDVMAINNTPDGKNINLDCGSTMPDNLKKAVCDNKADIGIAFDGDGDRVLMADNHGNTIDGDHILFLIAKFLLEKVPDFNRIVVGTVMGNLGLEKALQLIGVSYLRTDVGDKYVYREMKAQDAILGGEQSGHTILRAFQKTGDGILTALCFLEALFYFELSPSEVFDSLHLYPQVIRNVKIREKRDIGSWVELTR
ncbi:MAG: phosphoglucosamine mutase, partial [bacterium]|nr:phosphoglucosamine mutase [bacterium]